MSQSKSFGGIENELKFVLDLSGTKRVLESAHKIIEIKQGYLSRTSRQSARIRQSKENNQIQYQFTFKQKIRPGVSIELDSLLTEKLYHQLVPHACSWVNKTRAVIEGWDIDVFRDHKNQPYFLLAEIEMSENQKTPERLLPVVQEFLIYSVPREDSRFSSRKLSSVNWAEKMLKKIYNSNRLTFK